MTSMRVSMMQVGVMRVLVPHGCMPMPVRMRLGHWPVMVMLVVLVMNMNVVMLQGLMIVLMVMPFGQMKPEANRH